MNGNLKLTLKVMLYSIAFTLSTSIVLLFLALETNLIQYKSIQFLHSFTLVYSGPILFLTGIFLFLYKRKNRIFGVLSVLISMLWIIHISWSLATK